MWTFIDIIYSNGITMEMKILCNSMYAEPITTPSHEEKNKKSLISSMRKL
jgi:hypothetical protein